MYSTRAVIRCGPGTAGSTPAGTPARSGGPGQVELLGRVDTERRAGAAGIVDPEADLLDVVEDVRRSDEGVDRLAGPERLAVEQPHVDERAASSLTRSSTGGGGGLPTLIDTVAGVDVALPSARRVRERVEPDEARAGVYTW